MRCVGMIRVVCVTASILLACGRSPAIADPLLDDIPSAGILSRAANSEKFLYFSGFDLWRNGGMFYGGAQWAPGGLNNDGFTLKVLLAEGSYRYLSGPTDIRVGAHLTSFKTGEFEWALGAGYVEDNNRRSGAYGRLSVLTRR